MYGLSEKIIEEIKKVTNKYKNNFVIFGSRAREKYKENSDIDIALMDYVDKKTKYKIRNDFDLIDTAYKIDVVFIQDIANDEFICNIKEDGIKI